MIIEVLVGLIFSLINGLMELIPAITLPAGFVALLDDVRFLLEGANYFVPIPTVMICLGLIFLVDNVKFFVSIFNWIIAKIPTIN